MTGILCFSESNIQFLCTSSVLYKRKRTVLWPVHGYGIGRKSQRSILGLCQSYAQVGLAMGILLPIHLDRKRDLKTQNQNVLKIDEIL